MAEGNTGRIFIFSHQIQRTETPIFVTERRLFLLLYFIRERKETKPRREKRQKHKRKEREKESKLNTYMSTTNYRTLE